jgi:hypothetical protein
MPRHVYRVACWRRVMPAEFAENMTEASPVMAMARSLTSQILSVCAAQRCPEACPPLGKADARWPGRLLVEIRVADPQTYPAVPVRSHRAQCRRVVTPLKRTETWHGEPPRLARPRLAI